MMICLHGLKKMRANVAKSCARRQPFMSHINAIVSPLDATGRPCRQLPSSEANKRTNGRW